MTQVWQGCEVSNYGGVWSENMGVEIKKKRVHKDKKWGYAEFKGEVHRDKKRGL